MGESATTINNKNVCGGDATRVSKNESVVENDCVTGTLVWDPLDVSTSGCWIGPTTETIKYYGLVLYDI